MHDLSARGANGSLTSLLDGADTLEGVDIGVYYDSLRAVDGVDVKVRSGEILGLIGPNGAGKTTLLNALTGFARLSTGAVILGGRVASEWSPARRARHGLARTFQSVRLFAGMTIRENVEAAAVAMGRNRGSARETSSKVLADLDLLPLADSLADGIPHGIERRLGIARAMAQEPKFLLLDEPAAGLNEAEADELVAQVKLIRDTAGCGMILIEHDMRVIMNACDQVQVLDYGQTIARAAPAEVQSDRRVQEAYLGAEATARHGEPV